MAQNGIERMLMGMLRPLARVMIAKGVTISHATELLKRAMVEMAKTQTGDPQVSDSRISVLTGLHRKDVRRLRATDPLPPRRSMLNACALLIAHWTTEPAFLAEGGPRPLPRSGTAGLPGFDDLVRAARIDVAPATILEELAAQGAVELEADGTTVTLVHDAFVGSPQSDALLEAFEKNVGAHLNVAAANLLNEVKGSRQFERALHFSHLSEASLRYLEDRSARAATALLHDLNAMAMARQAEDALLEFEATGRFSFGAYVLAEGQGEGKVSGDTVS